jgi:hypothetical protein
MRFCSRKLALFTAAKIKHIVDIYLKSKGRSLRIKLNSKWVILAILHAAKYYNRVLFYCCSVQHKGSVVWQQL